MDTSGMFPNVNEKNAAFSVFRTVYCVRYHQLYRYRSFSITNYGEGLKRFNADGRLFNLCLNAQLEDWFRVRRIALGVFYSLANRFGLCERVFQSSPGGVEAAV